MMGQYCTVWCAENSRSDNPGFVITSQIEVGKRGDMDISAICRVNASLVDYQLLPSDWVQGVGGNPKFGWSYVGPSYWIKKK